ncbi:MAG TPA: methyltransferase domain-containing protein [Gaiella sp.]|jgi:ubiquinone/menaquinone biosynthesis C-methylase UbiE|nr:methyltransferase domain-containing protein [Gaiella sp.]
MGAERENHGRAVSFGAVADVYERARPGYPDDAVRWLAGQVPVDVVDVGAGTGKLTRSLVAHGHRVTAVEPLEAMLEQLRAAAPSAAAVVGSAESIPLPDGSADVVTAAQAFHWFDQPVALREIARVLRPGGRIALVWNARDDREEWVAEFTDTIVGRSVFREGGVLAATASIDESGMYGPVERATFDHVQTLGRSELVELVRSRSDCAVLSEEERRPVLEHVEALFDAHATDGTLAMPYVTECFRAPLA